jgi:Xaa-Pro aminopeptidase
MLTTEERGWLNRYHQRVYTMLAPHLAAAEQQWLAEATATI